MNEKYTWMKWKIKEKMYEKSELLQELEDREDKHRLWLDIDNLNSRGFTDRMEGITQLKKS